MTLQDDVEAAARRAAELKAEAAKIAAYARGEKGDKVPYITEDLPFVRHFKAETATVTPLKPPQAPSLRDEILAELETLVAAIKSGEVSPCHLILAYGNDTGDTIEHEWFGYGLSLFEMIGHLQMQVTALATELNE